MTEKQLLAALTEECRANPGRIEDFLLALSDTIIEELSRGERVNLGKLGSFELRPIIKDGEKKPLAAVRHRPSVEMRDQLKLADLHWNTDDICPSCKKRELKKEALCSTCRSKKYGRYPKMTVDGRRSTVGRGQK